MKVAYNKTTLINKTVAWNELEYGHLYIRADEDGDDSPRIFMYLEHWDEYFIVPIFECGQDEAYFSDEEDVGFYEVTVSDVHFLVHRYGKVS